LNYRWEQTTYLTVHSRIDVTRIFGRSQHHYGARTGQAPKNMFAA